jgi:hypothetical protein
MKDYSSTPLYVGDAFQDLPPWMSETTDSTQLSIYCLTHN